MNGLVFLSFPRCGCSPVYRSREMAARALVPFVMMDEIPDTIRTLLAKLPDYTDQCFRQNHIHGTLLQVSIVTLSDFCQTQTLLAGEDLLYKLFTLSVELFSTAERTSIS